MWLNTNKSLFLAIAVSAILLPVTVYSIFCISNTAVVDKEVLQPGDIDPVPEASVQGLDGVSSAKSQATAYLFSQNRIITIILLLTLLTLTIVVIKVSVDTSSAAHESIAADPPGGAEGKSDAHLVNMRAFYRANRMLALIFLVGFVSFLFILLFNKSAELGAAMSSESPAKAVFKAALGWEGVSMMACLVPIIFCGFFGWTSFGELLIKMGGGIGRLFTAIGSCIPRGSTEVDMTEYEFVYVD